MRLRHLIIILSVCAAVSGRAGAQEALKFDAVSIRKNTSGDERSGFRIEATRLSVSNRSLESLIEIANGIKSYQVLGAPTWLSTERFDIEATTGKPATRTQVLEMLRDALRERCMLEAHRETKEIPALSLTVDKAGSRLREVPPDDHPQVLFSKAGTMTQLTGMKAPISLLVPWLTSILMGTSRPVVDQTGLAGAYDFELEWPPDDDATAGAGLSITRALREQLGLHLDPKRIPIDVLTIDHVERPSPNQ